MTAETPSENEEQARGCEASELSGLVMRLQYYNDWRRGDAIGMPDPIEIGRDIDSAITAINELQKKQAKIDALMLEYCPNEMTKEQMLDWERHQKPVDA